MTDDAALIEQIVQEVLKQFSSSAPAVRAETSSTPANAAAFSLAEKVVTGELLEQRVNGHKTVSLRPGAVLTPTARDYLRTHGIAVVRQSANVAVAKSSAWKLIVTAAGESLERAIDDAGLSRELLSGTGEAAATAISIVCRDAAGAVVFSDEPETVACLANRNHKVRAAVVCDGRDAKQLAAQIGANVLAVNPQGKSYFELRNILRAVTTLPTPKVPDNWSES